MEYPENTTLRFSRRNVSLNCYLDLSDIKIKCQMVNLSSSGVLIEAIDCNISDLDLKKGDVHLLEFNDSERSTIVNLRVVRVLNETVAMKFIDLNIEQRINIWELLGPYADKIEK